MREKTDRNQRIYQFYLKHPNMTYSNMGKIFKHPQNGTLVPLSSGAICRILKREKQRLESNPGAPK